MADSASPEFRAFYRERRTSEPVFFDPRARSWFVCRYDDVKTAMSDWQSFSSDYQKYLPESPLAKVFDGTLLGFDPPRHLKLRGIVSRAFTPRSVEELGPRISEAVRDLIAGFKDRGRCELVSEFASIVPVYALADFLGVHKEKYAYFRDIAVSYLAMFDAVISGKQVERGAEQELDAYFEELLEQRRRSPREDLITRLLQAEVDGERLTKTELSGFCRLLLVAGIGTTSRLIAIALQTLLEHPSELARLRADPRLLPAAIEEVTRYRPPVNVWFRVTTKDVELGGVRIPAHQQLLMVIGSANRDEAHFAEPDRFDITRNPNPHLGFGNGAHFCLGAPLARLESRLALSALLTELNELSVEGPLTALPGIQANGVTTLPLCFRPR